MNDNASLLPPVRVINERLTHNQRERRRLRTLLRLAIEVSHEQQNTTGTAPSPADLVPIRLTGDRLKRKVDETMEVRACP